MSRKHSDWIADYVATISPRSEAPERYIYWSAVATIGGAIRRRCYIDMGHFKWYPNWFITLVGPPGLVKKSTTVDIAMGLLREVPGVNFGSDINTWEGFIQELEEARDAFATGSSTNYLDQTYEMSSALTLAISEWGTFVDPANHMMINVLTDLWDCKDTPMRKNTKTQGSNTIVAPFLNMISGTTPKWMHDNFRFGGWGFSARCIFLHADEVSQSIPYPDELWTCVDRNWKRSFIEDLTEISELEGPITLSPEAREIGRQWYVSNQDRIKSFSRHKNADPWVAEYLARKQVHIFKLCLCLAVSRGRMTITDTDMLEAIKRCNQVEGELTKIFAASRSESRIAALNKDVWSGLQNILATEPRISWRKAMQFTFQWMSQGEASALLKQLIEIGFLSQHVEIERGGQTTWIALGPEAPQPTVEAASPAADLDSPSPPSLAQQIDQALAHRTGSGAGSSAAAHPFEDYLASLAPPPEPEA